jgi:hypothetical protein
MEDDGIFYGQLIYFMVIWYILWPFGIFCVNLVYFFRFGMLYLEKSGINALNNNGRERMGTG